MKNNRLLKLMSLMVIFFVCTLFGVFSLTAKTASAESTFHELGASIRVSTNNPGIRFGFGLPSGVTGTGYTVGTLVMPKEELGSKALKHNNDTTSSNTLDYTEIICSKKWIPNGQIPSAQSGYNYYYATLINIPTTRFSEVLCARSYYCYNGTYYYSDVIERSIGYVGSVIMNKGEEDAYGVVDNIVKTGFGNTALTVNSTHELINSGATETFTAVNSKGYLPVWSTSNTTVGTGTITNGGVFTADRTGDVNVVATIGNVTQSKTVYIMGDALDNDNISVCSCGWDVSDQGFIYKSHDVSGNMVITATFRGDPSNVEYGSHGRPGLVLRNIPSKAYFQKLISEGYTRISFEIAVGGTSSSLIDDLYVFGKQLITFPYANGRYRAYVTLQHIVDNYSTIAILGTATGCYATRQGQMFISWNSNEASDDAVRRYYTFTISSRLFRETPTVSISGGSSTIVAGDTTSLTASTSWSSSDVVWSSSNTSVATVSSSGVVTGVAAGSATIYATVGGVQATKSITVNAVSISISGNSSVVVGDTITLTATKNVSDAVTWSSSNTSKATVNSSGVVTGVAAGSVTIYATVRGVQASKTITVNAVTISISGSSSVTEGDTITLTATKNVSDAVTWTSSNTSYATVSSSGVVTAQSISSNQTVTITATVRGVKATKSITVNAATVSISGSSSDVAGKSISLTASTNATTGTVSWTTSDSSVATVSSGVVTTKKYGSVTITASFRGATATKSITVTRPFETSELAVRSNGGYKYTSGSSYCTVGTGTGDQINVSCCFVGNTSYYPQVMINPKAQSVYSGLNSAGYSYLIFDLVVEGSSSNKLSDIYILATGQAISSFTKSGSTYKIWIATSNLSSFRDTMYGMFNNADPAGASGSKSAMFIAWRNTAADNGVYRYYTFKMSNIRYSSSKS